MAAKFSGQSAKGPEGNTLRGILTSALCWSCTMHHVAHSTQWISVYADFPRIHINAAHFLTRPTFAFRLPFPTPTPAIMLLPASPPPMEVLIHPTTTTAFISHHQFNNLLACVIGFIAFGVTVNTLRPHLFDPTLDAAAASQSTRFQLLETIFVPKALSIPPTTPFIPLSVGACSPSSVNYWTQVAGRVTPEAPSSPLALDFVPDIPQASPGVSTVVIWSPSMILMALSVLYITVFGAVYLVAKGEQYLFCFPSLSLTNSICFPEGRLFKGSSPESLLFRRVLAVPLVVVTIMWLADFVVEIEPVVSSVSVGDVVAVYFLVGAVVSGVTAVCFRWTFHLGGWPLCLLVCRSSGSQGQRRVVGVRLGLASFLGVFECI